MLSFFAPPFNLESEEFRLFKLIKISHSFTVSDEQYAGLQFKCEYRLTRKAENEQNSHEILAILCRVGTEGGARATSEHSKTPPPPPLFFYFIFLHKH